MQGLPCLVSLCRFRAIFHRGPRPPFGPRPARHDLFPFSDRFNTPQGARPTTVRPVPGSYDLSPFIRLSSSAQTQAAPRRPRQGGAGKKHAAQFKTTQIAARAGPSTRTARSGPRAAADAQEQVPHDACDEGRAKDAHLCLVDHGGIIEGDSRHKDGDGEAYAGQEPGPQDVSPRDAGGKLPKRPGGRPATSCPERPPGFRSTAQPRRQA